MKRRRSLPFLLAGVFALVLVACSTDKDAFLNRTFHRLVARDNYWFNANEKLKESVAAMEKAYVDDYDEVLPIFIYGSEDQAKAMVPDMEKCIEKCATVIDRHSMEFGGKEKNTWVDDAYFVIGRAHFYKRSYFDAERTFDFVARRYKGENRQMEAKMWLARTAIQVEQYAKAQTALDEVKNQKQLPKHFPHDQLSAVQADLDIHRGKTDDAITDLEHAVQIAKRKKDKVRWSFILAQLYELKGMQDKAVAQFNKVAHMNPPYEMGFHAEIFQALAFDRGDSKAFRQKLHRMLRDEKNKDHFDMIHYALAELDLKENKDSSAIAELKVSTAVSTTDTRQKAKSFLKLADLFFDDKKYPPAQQYYDSTAALIPETHKRHEEVVTRAEVLGDLVEQLNIIAREDSLQAFAKLDPAEQEKRVRRLIKEREREEEEKAEQEAAAREAGPVIAPVAAQGPATSAGAWYFYNPTQIGRGVTEFKKKWGPRTNDDNWRRKDKGGSATVEAAQENPDEADSDSSKTAKKEGEPEWKDPANYLKDIPKDSAALEASNSKVCEALYLAGMIYKEKLKDIDNAIESFEVLNGRFEDCRYTPEAHYQMYRIYLEKERTGNFMGFSEESTSKYWADRIMERWPDSEFARLVKDPNQLQADEANKQAEEEAYNTVYEQFRNGYYIPVITACERVLTEQPKNHLLSKYQLLKAMAVGGTHEMLAFRNALEQVKAKFPGTDEAQAASGILADLDRPADAPPPPPPSEGDGFKMDQGQHYFVLLFPNIGGDASMVKAKIDDFNKAYFRNTTIQITSSVLDKNSQVILLKLFESKDKAMEYYDLFKSNKDLLAGINDRGYPMFAISPANYQRFYTTKDVEGYTAFFGENYLEKQ